MSASTNFFITWLGVVVSLSGLALFVIADTSGLPKSIKFAPHVLLIGTVIIVGMLMRDDDVKAVAADQAYAAQYRYPFPPSPDFPSPVFSTATQPKEYQNAH